MKVWFLLTWNKPKKCVWHVGSWDQDLWTFSVSHTWYSNTYPFFFYWVANAWISMFLCWNEKKKCDFCRLETCQRNAYDTWGSCEIRIFGPFQFFTSTKSHHLKSSLWLSKQPINSKKRKRQCQFNYVQTF